MKIDIRDNSQPRIDSIQFGDGHDPDDAYVLTLCGSLTKVESEDSFVYINNKQDAINLIKAVEKALELGTWG